MDLRPRLASYRDPSGRLRSRMGAIRVGNSQAEILKRQAKIQEGQLRLERSRHKHELFERRYAFYDLFSRYVDTMKSRGPESLDALELEAEFMAEYRKAIFLFPRDFSSEIEIVISATQQYVDKRRALREAESGLEREDIRSQLNPLRLTLWSSRAISRSN